MGRKTDYKYLDRSSISKQENTKQNRDFRSTLYQHK